MPQTSGCATPDELERYIAGRLSAEDTARVANHLCVCDACWGVVRSRQVDEPTRPGLSHPPSTPVGGPDTQSLSSAKSPFAFLAPPHEADELGWLGQYRILKLLGRGGMGMVFEAEDVHLRRRVALKVMLPELSGGSRHRDRFLREARTMAAVTHDHIVTVYHVGLAAGSSGKEEVPVLAMQLLAGETLEDRLARAGRLSIAEAVRVARHTADGLAAAHAQGLIHRDIKPANLWLEAPHGRVKILDFGLARWQEGGAELSGVGQVVGTPYYMAPEQGAGERTDHRADLFSLGCVLYVMLTGQRPFDGSGTMAVLTALAVREPKPLETILPETPPALAALVKRLLAKDPAQRVQSASEVARELAALGLDDSSVKPAPPAADPPRPTPRRRWLLVAAGLAGLLAIAAGVAALVWHLGQIPGQSTEPSVEPIPIVVGVIHSLSGPMRESEKPVLEMTRLTLEDINRNGGLLGGRPIRLVVRDGASNENTFATEAEDLIVKEHASVLFGCWTSASRKAVREVVEQHNHLLIYPVQHEGLEQSSNILYTGAAPNQQLLPAVDWCVKKGFKRFFLVGSDYVFPRAANAILGDKIRKEGCEVVGEEYLLLSGNGDVEAVVKKIDAAKPDVILNTINGSANLAFFPALREHGLTPQRLPTISFSLDEASVRSLDAKQVVGDYLAWNYFQDLPGEANKAFVKRFLDYYGDFRGVTDPMEGAYLGVRFWAQAVADAQSVEPSAVRRALRRQSLDAPEGPNVRVDPDTQHTVKYFRLGQIGDNWRIKVIEEHETPTPPQPFPPSRKREEWEQLLRNLYKGWGNRWSSPGS